MAGRAAMVAGCGFTRRSQEMPLTLRRPPSTEEEAAQRAKPVLLPDGTYPAHIRDARDAVSKKNRPMIVPTFVVTDEAGNERELPLYLNTSDAGLLVLRHTCSAVGAIEAFEAGEID